MISVIEVYAALREKLEALFPNITVQQKDIKNITRPSFYIQYIGKSFYRNASEFFEDNFSFNIVYFAQNESLLELLEVEETLTQNLSEPLLIIDNNKTVFAEIDNLKITPEENDYYLTAVIDFKLTQHLTENIDDMYTMEELE